jgi:hypothetical protein
MTIHVRGANYAYGTLTAPITAGSATVTFSTDAGASFPALSATTAHAQQYYYLTLVDAATQGAVTREIVKVVGPSSGGVGTITVPIIRAQDGTSAHAFALGDGARLRWCEQMAIDYASQGCPIGWYNVQDFGAMGDGVTDDTASIQAAIAAATAANGGTVYCPAGNYLCNGVLALTDNVTLRSTVGGNTGAWATTGGLPVRCATFSITNTGTTFITASGRNTGIRGFIFYYPNQALPTAVTPTAYPYTVTSTGGDFTMDDCTFINSYDAINIQSGRQYLSNLHVGAIHTGINGDFMQDVTTFDNIAIGSGAYALWFGYSFPSNLDLWSLANMTGMSVARADSFKINNMEIFFCHTGIQFIDSLSASPPNSYGMITNLSLDSVINGIICKSTRDTLNLGGVKISNLQILGYAGGGGSNIALWLPAGGSQAPFLTVVNGAIRNTFAAISTVAAGVLNVDHVWGADLPNGLVTPPAIPASTVAATNPYPYPCHVAINAGTVTNVSINGSALGGPQTMVRVPPNGTIALTYSVIPTSWVWISAS